MGIGRVILVEPAHAGNLGAAMRVAANFGVPRMELVNPSIQPVDEEVLSWACGAQRHLTISHHESLDDAAREVRILIATASGRGRQNQPLVSPREAAQRLTDRPPDEVALVFGNETRGLSKRNLDRCDFVVQIPTVEKFPVLNLTQSIAILLSSLHPGMKASTHELPCPAPHSEVEALMDHLRISLTDIGFLDPANPDRILRKIRRLLGRAGATENEVAILRGMCRQIQWAARTGPKPDHVVDEDS